MLVEFWGMQESQRCQDFKAKFVKYIDRKYKKQEIELTKLVLHEYNTLNPWLEIKFIQNKSIHQHTIRLDRLPKYCHN